MNNVIKNAIMLLILFSVVSSCSQDSYFFSIDHITEELVREKYTITELGSSRLRSSMNSQSFPDMVMTIFDEKRMRTVKAVVNSHGYIMTNPTDRKLEKIISHGFVKMNPTSQP
jgi:hypothetical protein